VHCPENQACPITEPEAKRLCIAPKVERAMIISLAGNACGFVIEYTFDFGRDAQSLRSWFCSGDMLDFGRDAQSKEMRAAT